MKTKFTVEGIGTTTKELQVRGPEGFELSIKIDYDDVWHSRVAQQSRKLCRILNKHWTKGK